MCKTLDNMMNKIKAKFSKKQTPPADTQKSEKPN